MKNQLDQTTPSPVGSTLYALERHSFSDEAARRITEVHPGLHVENVESIKEVQKAILEKGAHGLIPVENSSGGLVVPHIDWLAKSDISVVMDIRHRIYMCAGRIAGSKTSPIKRVHSHSKGLDQCSEWLGKLSNAKLVSADSTAAAARLVAESGDPGDIVLGSRNALTEANLEVYDSDIANDKGDKNITQFFMGRKNGKNILPDPEAQYHAVIFQPQDELGSLSRILSMIKRAGVNLTSIHSRTIGMKEYKFFVEMERRGTPKQFERLSKRLQVGKSIQLLKWLGSWNERIED